MITHTHNDSDNPESRSALNLLLVFILLPWSVFGQFPDMGSEDHFAADLRRVSMSAILPVPRLMPGHSQLLLAPLLLPASSGIQMVQQFEFILQHSTDFALRAGLERWPGDKPMIGTSLSLNTFHESEGKNDYSLGISWHHIQYAHIFSQRDVAVQAGILRSGEKWSLQTGFGPILRHSVTPHISYNLDNGTEWAGFGRFYFRLTEHLHLSMAIPFSTKGAALKIAVNWNLSHGLPLGSKVEEELE